MCGLKEEDGPNHSPYLCKELPSQWCYTHLHPPKKLRRSYVSIFCLHTSVLLKCYNLSFLFQDKREKLMTEPISRQIFIPKFKPTSHKHVQLHCLQSQLLLLLTRVLLKPCSTWHMLTKLSLIELAFLKNITTQHDYIYPNFALKWEHIQD